MLASRLSNTLEAGFCVDCLEKTLHANNRPAIFNTDQGSQFTSETPTIGRAVTEVHLAADEFHLGELRGHHDRRAELGGVVNDNGLQP